jgi:hypothetical protein
MWPFGKRNPEPVKAEQPPHPLASRISEIERTIERGFYASQGPAGAFAVVAQMLAELDARIAKIEAKAAGDSDRIS